MTPNAAAGMGRGLHQEIQEVTAQMEMLKVPELKAICRSMSQPIAGRKADLQDRIRTFLKDSCTIGNLDPWRPKAVRILIEKLKLGETLPKYEDLWKTLRTGAYYHPVATGHQPVSSLEQPSRTAGAPSQVGHGYAAWPSEVARSEAPKAAAAKRPCLYFKPTPFYKLIKLIPETAQKINITSVRGACIAKFKLSKADWTMLESDKKYRLYLLCGAYGNAPSAAGEYIQFPHPNEIRFNNVQVKDNVRGLKNKLGTAKPADLTPYLRPYPQQNILEVVYAFTKNEYCIYCYIVEVVTPEHLLEEVLKRPKIIKAATLNYIKKCLSEEEDDLITTSTVMTLQCPVSYTRMRYPVKSIMCNHLQCYDALWYIYSQLQVPTWQCPVCQIDIKLSDLAICEYVDEILKNSNEDVEQVELSTDGSWRPLEEESNKPKESSKAADTVVKKEFSEDSDENDVPLSKLVGNNSMTGTPANEPVVISLDSDTEENTNHETEQNANKATVQNTHNTNSIPSGGWYMDHAPSISGPTLDPRAHGTNTPTVPRQMMEANENSLSFVNRTQQIPNILGKTPLNNGELHQEASLPEPASPTPISSNRGQQTPALSASESPMGLEECNPQISGADELAASPPSLRRPSNPQTTSILGLTGQVMRPPEIRGSIPPLTNNNGDSRPANGSLHNGLEYNNLINGNENAAEVPQLPPLPSRPLASNIGNARLDSPVQGSGPLASPTGGPLPPAHPRGRRPIVSPFIPKKPYLNLLPQKRHIANTSPPSPNSFGAEPHALGTSASEGLMRSDDVIDLTSD
ncbi:hypothetical protein HG536_0A05270 [Torulaspora globosa]|uniref:E3 SUMO-protein transferase SIZ2 n=1 Tax=Torulaspora globosa TaxID=48254 RepID=A0A7G3ZB26_9SACH|nr:uncharacterized protein HG536_0A05270 [Torulaspora globosa]QLL30712.1 hypothetical protein HG536_0A05270 [Torulaspora globosa]